VLAIWKRSFLSFCELVREKFSPNESNQVLIFLMTFSIKRKSHSGFGTESPGVMPEMSKKIIFYRHEKSNIYSIQKQKKKFRTENPGVMPEMKKNSLLTYCLNYDFYD
jgi:hypothetical protein